jgi:signal transduction histidine kinase
MSRGEVDEEFRIVRPDGELRWLHNQIFPIYNERGEVYRIAGIIEDITERKLAERELQQLTARLLTLQDDERRRIARELHDVTPQNMFATTLNLSEIQDCNGEPPIEVRTALKQCQILTRQSLQEIRTLSYLLHPPLLDQAGLVSALRWYIEGFSKRSGIYASLVTSQEIGRLPLECETALFRVAQECLTNIYRHSGSETATIQLERSAGEVKLIVKDEGRGMGKIDLRVGATESQELGVGIPGMQQRLRLLGGQLKIESNDGGTTVIAIVPLREKSHANSIGR